MNSPDSDRHRKSSTVAINAFSRVIAVMLLMGAFGFCGVYLDKKLGTVYWAPVGFVLGMFLMIVGVIYISLTAEHDRKIGAQSERSSVGKTDQEQHD